MAEKAEEKSVAKETKTKREDNTILIGQKPVMSYVLAVVTQFGDGKTKEVNVKARGRGISKAVDVVEIVRNKFAKDAKVKGINIGTDKLKTREGRDMNVSSISIALAK